MSTTTVETSAAVSEQHPAKAPRRIRRRGENSRAGSSVSRLSSF